MAEVFNRNLGIVADLAGGEYTTRTASGEPAVCCRRCGTITELVAPYEKDCDGRVAPALQCSGCNLHEYAKLDSWNV